MRFPKIEHFRQQSLSRHFTKKKKTGRTWTSWTFYFGQNGRGFAAWLGKMLDSTCRTGQCHARPSPQKTKQDPGLQPQVKHPLLEVHHSSILGKNARVVLRWGPIGSRGPVFNVQLLGGNMSSGMHWSVPACLAVKLMGVCTSLQPEKGDSATLCKATAAIGGPLLLTAIQRVGPLPTGTRCASGCGGKPPLGGR